MENVDVWDVVAVAELIKASNNSDLDNGKEPEIEELLLNYAAAAGKMFAALESYALELKAIQFETARTFEIYRLVRGYHFDSLGHETEASRGYDSEGPYVPIYETMFTMKDIELKCYEVLAEVCKTHDINQLSSCVVSVEYGQKLAMQMIDQVREIIPDGKQKWEEVLADKYKELADEKWEENEDVNGAIILVGWVIFGVLIVSIILIVIITITTEVL